MRAELLAPEFGGLGSGAIEPDSRVLTALFGDYRFIQDEDLTLGVTGSAYRSWQFEFSQFDLSNFMGGAYVNRSVGCWLWGANYQFLDTLLDGDQFNAEHRLVLSGTFREGDFGHTTGYYEYENVDLQAPALIPAQLRSGDVNGPTELRKRGNGRSAGRALRGNRFPGPGRDDGRVQTFGGHRRLCRHGPEPFGAGYGAQSFGE